VSHLYIGLKEVHVGLHTGSVDDHGSCVGDWQDIRHIRKSKPNLLQLSYEFIEGYDFGRRNWSRSVRLDLRTTGDGIG